MAQDPDDYDVTLRELLQGASVPEAAWPKIRELARIASEQFAQTPQGTAAADALTATVGAAALDATVAITASGSLQTPLLTWSDFQNALIIYDFVKSLIGDDSLEIAGAAATTVGAVITLWLIKQILKT